MEFTWEDILICEVEAQSLPEAEQKTIQRQTPLLDILQCLLQDNAIPSLQREYLFTICDTFLLLHDLHLQDRVHSLLQWPLAPEILYVLHQSVVL
jgi:hypothetical protein